MTNPFIPKATKIALLQSKFHRITKHRMTHALKAVELNTVQWIILGFLEHRGGTIPFSVVGEEVGIQDSFLTVIATKLEKRALVQVIPDVGDKRKKGLCITKEGKKILALSQQQFLGFFQPLLKGISIHELENFLVVIKKIIKNDETLNGK